MNGVELIIVTLLIVALTGRVLMSAYGVTGVWSKRMRIVDIPIALLLVAFCVIVVKSVISAVGA